MPLRGFTKGSCGGLRIILDRSGETPRLQSAEIRLRVAKNLQYCRTVGGGEMVVLTRMLEILEINLRNL